MTTRSLHLSIKDFSAVTVTALTVFLVTLASPIQAATLVTNRSDLGGNDLLDWSSLGKVFNPFNPNPSALLPNSFSATSQEGRGLDVEIQPTSSPGITPPFVFQTAAPPQGIPTNFANGDFLLLTGLNPTTFPALGNPGPLSITFDTPVFGAGVQIAIDDQSSFTAFVSAFDSTGTLLGAFQVPGTSSLTLDNSAVFLGVSSDTPNISKLVYSTSASDRAFAINTLTITAVPEATSTLGLLAVGAVGAGSTLKRKLSHQTSAEK
ncbi:MAG TPA: hypothetical protein V6C85_20840 [Allocoleopsis sp.]